MADAGGVSLAHSLRRTPPSAAWKRFEAGVRENARMAPTRTVSRQRWVAFDAANAQG